MAEQRLAIVRGSCRLQQHMLAFYKFIMPGFRSDNALKHHIIGSQFTQVSGHLDSQTVT